MIPKNLNNLSAPKRSRMLEMLVQAVPYLIDNGCGQGTDSNPAEDHHALVDLGERLNCDKDEARLLLRLAMNEFPSLKIIHTGAL